jgi:3-hydroxyisobutyrate dehydrogenase
MTDTPEGKSMQKPRVAFIGLGVMGFPMAGHLVLRGGLSVTVFNRTRARADAWFKRFGQDSNQIAIAETPSQAAENADIVFACVGDDPDLRAITTGPQGAFSTLRKGAIFVDHTTASADIARELSQEAARKGFSFLDAPVSGGQAGAENGALTVMVGGEANAFEVARPIIGHFAKAVTHMGPAGSGQLTKMVNQICIAGLLEGLAEGLNLAEKVGLDLEKVLAVISKGAAQSWQMENRGHTMAAGKFDFGFAVDWMRKDLRICVSEAERIGASLPATQLIATFYDELSRNGGGRWDTSSLIQRLRGTQGK